MILIRPMRADDVPAAHVIRLAVRENRLSDPAVVREQDYHEFMTRDTMSWVCDLNGLITGFIMVDLEQQNLWALFVAPSHERKGIGRALHDAMLTRYFDRHDTLRLTTAPGTRAAEFYRKAGYTALGPTSDGKEIIYSISKNA